MVVRRTLGLTLAALGLLAGACGDDGTAAPEAGPWPPACDHCDPVLVSATAGGGHATTEVTELADRRAVQEYAGRLSGSLARKVVRQADRIEVPEGYALGAAVVSVGCDVPPGVDVAVDEGPPTFRPKQVPTPTEECFAPVTTVALAPVPLARQ